MVRLNIFEYLLNANFVPALAMIFLLIFVCKNPLFGRRQTTIFVAAISMIIIAILAVCIDTLIDMKDKEGTFHIVRRVTSFLNFALSPFIPFLLLKIFNEKRTPIIFLLPLVINTLLCFVSIFVNVVFFISATNTYTRGFLFALPFAVTVFYVILLMIGDRRSHTRGKNIERAYLVVAIVTLGLSMILEVYFYARHFVWSATALIFVMYYLLLGIQARVTDTLTGLYNRAMYYNMLEKFNGKRKCVIAMLDINDFKRVNDTLGHEAGDKVLKTFAMLLEESMTSGAIPYRIGGDEFVCVGKHGNMETLKHSLEKLEEKCFKHNITFAWGAVSYSPDQDILAAVGEADALMYIDKESSKMVDDVDYAII